MVTPVHHVLVVEDDRDTARHLVSAVRMLGMTARAAATQEEAEAALAEETFCSVVLDKQLPAKLGDIPYASTGDAVQKHVRSIDARRTAEDHHVLPILVLTGAAAELEEARKAEFISKNFRDGASAYLPKPFDLDAFAREILAALERAGRHDHANCAALRPKPARATRKAPALSTLARDLGAAAWSDLTFVALDGHTLRITCRGVSIRCTYVELGFASAATRNPIDKWRVVLETCEGRGTFRGNPRGSEEAAKNAVYVTQTLLKKAFGLTENPYRAWQEGVGWRARFKAGTEGGEG